MENWPRSRWIRLVLPRKRKNAGVWHKGKRCVPCLLKWLTGFFTDAGIKLHHVSSAYQTMRLVWIYRLTVNSLFCWCTRVCNAECFAVKCLIQDLYLIWQLLFVTSITTSLFVCGQSAEWATLGLTKLTDCDNQQLSVDVMTTYIVTETKQLHKLYFLIQHTVPQHRQYLSYGGYGVGMPHEREKQFQKYRAQKALENVYNHRISNVTLGKEQGLIQKDKYEAQKIKLR